MKQLFYGLCAGVFLLVACNKDDLIEVDSLPTPTITLDSETAVYTVKTGRELTIAPTYENVENAAYAWSIDGEVVGRDATYVFCEQTVGEVYIALSVTTPGGTAEEELRVDVVDLERPMIGLPGAENGYAVLIDNPLILQPTVAETSIPTTFAWSVGGSVVSTEKDYTFTQSQTGAYTLRFATRNEDGEDSLEFTVKVCTQDEIPFGWAFEQTVYNLSAGRSIRLVPLDIANPFDATYTWIVDGRQAQQSADPAYIFSQTKEGTYKVSVTMKNSFFTVSKELTVNVCPAEGRYYRAGSSASSKDWHNVYEFCAAPGQFVNERYTATTMDEACAYAESQMTKNTYISLGSFGGYLVVGFDHSIDNDGDYNFAINGNSFDGSSEPGIVWVMQDENGDGQPNDTWYELKGSETGKPETIQDYAVTYYRPRGARMPVQWMDNRGGSGSIDYLQQFHTQDYYYPAWIEADSYTLRGTCLKARNYDQSGDGSYWVNPAYDWGYADNFSPIDRLTTAPNAGAAANPNHFKISDAVTFEGKPAELKYIDFVKVQTGLNAQSGWLGELSTEVYGVYDYNMTKKR